MGNIKNMNKELLLIFSNINEWLRFAEAKNAMIIAFNGASIYGIVKLPFKINPTKFFVYNNGSMIYRYCTFHGIWKAVFSRKNHHNPISNYIANNSTVIAGRSKNCLGEGGINFTHCFSWMFLCKCNWAADINK